jgi:type IV secretory pathway VirB10-like protein
MTDAEGKVASRANVQPQPEVEVGDSFRLRPERQRVTRLSRKALVGGTAVALTIISGAVFWALQTGHKRAPASDDSYSTDHHNVADQLSSLPKDYAGMPREVPRLGPPLPGDLGRPIVAAQNQSGLLAVDAEQQRVSQESEAARTSKVFAATNVRPSGANPTSNEATANAASSSDEAFSQNGQDRKLAFVNAPVDRRTTSPDRLAKPASPFVVQAGTIIPGALITGIRSDLPGQITAQVTESIFDSPTGRFLLIPQGTRLVGAHDSKVSFGQSRVLLVWTRLIMPNGRSIVLERQPGADTAGYSGLEDDVDNHWGALFKAALLSTLLGVGSELGAGSDSGTGNNGGLIQALRLGAGDSLNQTGQKIVQRNLNIQPTLTIRPGFPVRVIVNRDLLLEPYKG